MRMMQALVTFGALVAVSHGAMGLTIINTDSSTANRGRVENVSSGSSAEASQVRGAPPLPQQRAPQQANPAPIMPSPNQATTTAEVPTQQTAYQQNAESRLTGWVTEEGAPIEDESKSQGAASAANEARPLPERSISNSTSGGTSPRQQATSETAGVTSSSSYRINSGWVSDEMEELATKANYELKWDVGQDQAADFIIHREFSLSANDALGALGQLVEPYPIRLCLFQTDRIAQVIPVNKACN